MKDKLKLLTTAGAVILLFLFSFQYSSFAQERSPEEIRKEIEELKQKLGNLSEQKNTLSKQISQFNYQIKLTTLKIEETEEKITLLGGRIGLLENSLQSLSDAFSSRAAETYKMTRLGDPFIMLLMAPDLNGVVSRFHYLQRIQEADRGLLVRLQDAQINYSNEKTDQEELQTELEGQKQVLGVQKEAKADLLTVTKNDEKKYQQLLAQARAEYEAIQAITAGKGVEEKVGNVGGGERIASIIRGSSCNSSGSHLHFIVSDNGSTHNPFSYLKSVGHINCSGPGECSAADPFNPSGGWDWPINPTIRFNQGYGPTWAVQNTWVGKIYNFHNGIDVDSDSSEVKAVQSGILYRGSYGGSGGCRLRYVRVDHDGSNLDTYYLHINY